MGLFVPPTDQAAEWVPLLFALWLKSVVILTTAALLTFLLRSASAKLRHGLWCAALFSLLVLPLFSGSQPLRLAILPAGLFPTSRLETSGGGSVDLPEQRLAAFPADSHSAEIGRQLLVPAGEGWFPSSVSWPSVIFLVWLLGVLVVLARFVVGIIAVRRLVNRANELTDSRWSVLLAGLSQELGLKCSVSLLASDESIMPMTCRGSPAVILLPNEAVRWSADRRRVVVMHELIHVKRRDLFTQSVGRIVCALYWFNPLAWWAVNRLRKEQEWACDERVVASGVGRSDYAGHLLEIARSFRSDTMSAVTTTAMARPSQLRGRLCAILKPMDGHYRSGRMIVVSFVVMSIVFVCAAVTQFVTAERQSDGYVSSTANDTTLAEQREKFVSEPTTGALTAAQAPDDPRARLQTPTPTPSLDQRTETESPAPSEVAIDNQTKEQAVSGYTAEDQDRLASQGIGPAYIQEMADAGYPDLTVEQLIQFFSNSVRADYIAGLRSVGYDHVSVRDLLSLKTNGITPELIKSYHAVKHAGIEAKRYVALVTNDVTPSYWRSLADAGYDYLSANKAIAFRRAGITADFIVEARGRGYVNLSPNDLIELKRSEKY